MSDPSDYRAAQLRMKRTWNEGLVTWGHHAQRHMQEDGIDDVDVHHVIKFGRIADHEDSEYAGYSHRYTLRGNSVDGFRLRVVVDLDGRMMIVTCFVD